MAAVFEINLQYKKNILFSEIENVLSRNNLNYHMESIEIMDDWEYHNQIKIDNLKNCADFVLQGKIVMLKGLINSYYQFGVFFYMLEDKKFSIDFWISTKGLEMLDSNCITYKNVDIYNNITKQLILFLDKENLILCGMGADMLFSSNESCEETISNSSGVCRWIMPMEHPFLVLKKYNKSLDEGLAVYSLNE